MTGMSYLLAFTTKPTNTVPLVSVGTRPEATLVRMTTRRSRRRRQNVCLSGPKARSSRRLWTDSSACLAASPWTPTPSFTRCRPARSRRSSAPRQASRGSTRSAQVQRTGTKTNYQLWRSATTANRWAMVPTLRFAPQPLCR